jgi:hypothetical protein
MVHRISEGGGWIRYPGCYPFQGNIAEDYRGHDCRTSVYGMIEAANYITEGNPNLHINHISIDVTVTVIIAYVPVEITIPIADNLAWWVGCNWNIAGPNNFPNAPIEFTGLNIPGINSIILSALLPTVSQEFNQSMFVDVMAAADVDWSEGWGELNESAYDVSLHANNWLMMQIFAHNVMHETNSINLGHINWMKEVLCEYACPGPCYKEYGYAGNEFECNNEQGGFWDCGIQWAQGIDKTTFCLHQRTQRYNGIPYMLAYNLFQLAGGTENQNYFNPFNYEIDAENFDDLAEGYEGTSEVLTLGGGANFSPCNRTAQLFSFYSGESLHCPEATSSENIEIIQVSGLYVRYRILAVLENSWIQLVETCATTDECHLPRKIKINFTVKDKCDPACVTNNGQDVHVYINETWGIDDSKSFLGSTVFVHPGASLTIADNALFFDENSGIHVERGAKLHTNESLLTKCEQSLNWRGIGVSGNSALAQPNYNSTPTTNQSGIVHLEDSKIEKARFGVITAGSNSNFFDPTYYGGLVQCQNTTFLNNATGALFFKYDTPNKSKFIECSFLNDAPPSMGNPMGSGQGYGASIRETDGILFDKCSFTGFSIGPSNPQIWIGGSAGIEIYDAGCTVQNNCSFKNNHKGIAAYSTSPITSPDPIVVKGANGIWNIFENNFIGIQAYSTSLYENLQIEGNIFKKINYDAIELSGSTASKIHDNTFQNCDIGISAYSLGNQINKFYCNNFDGPTVPSIGIFVEGKSHKTEFLQNTYNTNTIDVVVSDRPVAGESGEVNPQQGTINKPADNCFTASHNYDILTSGTTVNFDYFVPNNNPSVCKIPTQPYPLNNFDNILTPAIISQTTCTFPTFVGQNPPTYDDYITIRQQLSSLSNQLNAHPNDPVILGNYLLADEHRDWMVSWVIRQAIISDYYPTAEMILYQEGTTDALRKLYGLRLQRNDIQGANTLLLALPINNADDAAFSEVQKINIARLQTTGNEFSLSPEQDQYLNTVAAGFTSSKEYAMSLLSMLKDQVFVLEHTPLNGFGGIVTPHSAAEIPAKPKQFSVNPNPSTGKLNVNLSEEKEEIQVLVYGIGSSTVKRFYFTKGKDFQLDLSDLPAGLYFVKVNTGAELAGFEKIVLVK